MIDRRAFLKILAHHALVPTLLGVGGCVPRGGVSQSYHDDASFKRALKRNPKLIGYQSIYQDELKSGFLTCEGTIPQALRGTLYRNGPARHDDGKGRRYSHWFDGDGMIQAFHFTDRGVYHHGKFVQTYKLQKERAQQKLIYGAFGTIFSDSPQISSPDEINVANINIISHGGELLALWEGGSAWRLNPDNLKTLGVKIWHSDLQNTPFSAHPRIEPDGSMWNFGIAPWSNVLFVMQISPSGTLLRTKIIKVEGLSLLHDFAVTENYIIFVIPPFLWQDNLKNSANMAYLDHFKWQPQQGTKIVILDKNHLNIVKQETISPFFHFHIGNAFEDKSGRITLDLFQSDNADLVTKTFRDIMKGNLDPASHPSIIHRSITIDPKVKKDNATLEMIGEHAREFPTLSPHKIGRKNRYEWCLEQGGAQFGFDKIICYHRDTGTTDEYHYGANFILDEHIFVPNPEQDADSEQGWIVGTGLDRDKGKTVLSIFDAQTMASGPIASAYLPYALPHGLHGSFQFSKKS